MIVGTVADVGVYFTAHAPWESLQVNLESFPAPLVDQVTVPVGDDPLTVALQVVDDPTAGDELVHAKVTELTVMAKLPLLPLLVLSPP